MLKKIWFLVLAFCFAQSLSAQNTSWSSLSTVRPGQKIEVVRMDSKSVKGEFSAYDDESISLIKKGRIVTYVRNDVLKVSLQGVSHRKKHVLIGMLVGAGAGLALGLISTNSDEGWEFVSDEAVTGSLAVIGAGVGALAGAAVPAHEYGVIYVAPDPAR